MPRTIRFLAAAFTLIAGVILAADPAPVSFTGHTDPVYAVAVSPDGTMAATGSFDKSIKLWDASTGKEIRTLAGPKGHESLVLSLAFSPAGDQLASGGADNFARVWDVPSRTHARTLPLGSAGGPVAVSADGKLFAAAAASGLIRLWPADGKPVDLTGHVGKVNGLTFLAEAKTLVSVGADRTLRYWASTTGKATTVKTVGWIAADDVLALPGNAGVLTMGRDGVSRIWPTTGNVKRVGPDAGSGRPLSLPNSNSYLTYGKGPNVAVRRAGDGGVERSLDGIGPVKVAAVSKNGQVIAVAGGPEPGVHLYATGDGRRIGTIAQKQAVIDLAFHPTGQSLAGALADNTVVTWNVVGNPGQPLPAEFGSVTQSFPHPAAVSSLAFVGEQLLTTAADGNIRLWRIAADVPSKAFQHPNLVDAVAYSPDGKTLATACHDGNLRLFDVAKAALTKQIAAHTTPQPTPVYAVAWTPDGKTVISAGFDQTIKLWDATAGILVREIKAGTDSTPGHRDQVFTVAVSADGKQLASGSSDRTVKLWELGTGKLIREFPNADLPPGKLSHPGFVHSVRFTADGAKIISAGTAPKGKGYVAVWSVADGKKLSGGEVAFGPVYGLATFPNGDLLLGCGPKERGRTNSDAVRLPLPGRVP